MPKTRVEMVNGVLMMVVPPSIAENRLLVPGAEVDLSIEMEVLRLKLPPLRPYSLEEMIAASDPEAFERTEEDIEWLTSLPVGRELI